MTVLVALRSDTHLVVGADTLASTQYLKIQHNTQKMVSAGKLGVVLLGGDSSKCEIAKNIITKNRDLLEKIHDKVGLDDFVNHNVVDHMRVHYNIENKGENGVPGGGLSMIFATYFGLFTAPGMPVTCETYDKQSGIQFTSDGANWDVAMSVIATALTIFSRFSENGKITVEHMQAAAQMAIEECIQRSTRVGGGANILVVPIVQDDNENQMPLELIPGSASDGSTPAEKTELPHPGDD